MIQDNERLIQLAMKTSEAMPRGESPREKKAREANERLAAARQQETQQKLDTEAKIEEAKASMPWDLRAFNRWMGYAHILSKAGFLAMFRAVAANWLFWVLRKSWQAWSFVSSLMGPRMGNMALRNAACLNCPALKRVKGKPYCGECSCPQGKWWWPFSVLWWDERGSKLWRWVKRVFSKNNLKKWNCPLGLHPDSIRMKKGCSSCGGANNGN